MIPTSLIFFFFFFNDTATTEIYTLSLHGRSSDLDLGMANAAGSYLSVFAGLLANSFGRRWIPSGVNFHAAWKLTPLGIQRLPKEFARRPAKTDRYEPAALAIPRSRSEERPCRERV